MKNRSFVVALVAFIAVSAVALTFITYFVSSGNVAQTAPAGFIVDDAYLRSSTPSSKSGAAFLKLTNNTNQDDRLIGVRFGLDGRIELHSHQEDANGVMRMAQIEGGVALPAGKSHMFKRGGDHMMFMGMTAPLVQQQEVAVTLIFEKAGEIEIVIPVDHARKPDH